MMAPKPLRLTNDFLEVDLLPHKGADIFRFVDRRTGLDVLFKTPWGLRDPVTLPPRPSTKEAWLERYGGGWQVLLPHGGDERVVDGVTRGYHGEAAILPWDVVNRSATSADLMLWTFTVPLQVHRHVELWGPVLRLHEAVTNFSSVPQTISWIHHPAFGPPFVDATCRLDTGAQTLIADAAAPGTVLAPDSIHQWPNAQTTDGAPLDLRRLPMADQPREIFGALTDFANPFFALTNRAIGFGIAMRWDPMVFPHAWFWQEVHSTPTFPWYRRAYAIAVEPSNVLPGEGEVDGRQRGAGLTINPGETVAIDLEMCRYDAPSADVAVVGVDPGGYVHFAAAGT